MKRQRPLPPTFETARMAAIPEKLREKLGAAFRAARWPVYLSGPTGVGKSCAAAVAYSFWEHGKAAWFDTEQIWAGISRIRQGHATELRRWHESGRWEYVTEGQLMQWVENASLVVWDDTGIKADSVGQAAFMLGCLNLRGKKPTIVTGNTSATRLHQVVDARVASRICAGTCIDIAGADLRLSAAKLVSVQL